MRRWYYILRQGLHFAPLLHFAAVQVVPLSVTSNAVVTRGTTMQEPSVSEGGRAYIQPRREEGPETGVRLSPDEFTTRIDPVYGDCFSDKQFCKI